MTCWHWEGEDLILQVRTVPRAARDRLGDPAEARLKVYITTPPVDGKANRHLVKFLARQFRAAPSRVHIERGQTSRDKRLRIEAPGRLPPGFAPLDA